MPFYILPRTKRTNPETHPRIDIFLDGRASYWNTFRFGKVGKQTEYRYSVGISNRPRRVVLDDEVRRILKSPQSMRDHMLSSYKKTAAACAASDSRRTRLHSYQESVWDQIETPFDGCGTQACSAIRVCGCRAANSHDSTGLPYNVCGTA